MLPCGDYITGALVITEGNTFRLEVNEKKKATFFATVYRASGILSGDCGALGSEAGSLSRLSGKSSALGDKGPGPHPGSTSNQQRLSLVIRELKNEHCVAQAVLYL